MKRALLAVVVIAMAIVSSGCNRNYIRGGGRCAGGQCGCPTCAHNNAYGPNAGGGGAMGGPGGQAYASQDPNGTYGANGGGAYGPGGGACGPNGCRNGGGLFGGMGGRPGGPCNYDPSVHSSDGGQPGPQTAQVAYPYYTTRGPRDYFLNNPGSIGR